MALRRDTSTVSLELSDTIARFTSEYDGFSVRTKEAYTYHLGVFATWAAANGIRSVVEIHADHLRDYMSAQKAYTYCRPRSTVVRSLSTETLQSRQQSVSTFLKWCKQQRYISDNPAEMVKKFKGEERARIAFTPDEVRRLITESGKAPGWLGYRDKAIVLLLLGTGCRADELLKLRPGSFEWRDTKELYGGRRGDRNLVLLNGKGRKDRRVQLGANAVEAVRLYFKNSEEVRRRTRGATGDDPFLVTYRFEPMVYSALNAMLKNLGKYSGVAGVIPHRFRHTFAVTDYRANKDILALRNRLGHADVKVTQRYLQSLGVDYGQDDSYVSPDDVYR